MLKGRHRWLARRRARRGAGDRRRPPRSPPRRGGDGFLADVAKRLGISEDKLRRDPGRADRAHRRRREGRRPHRRASRSRPERVRSGEVLGGSAASASGLGPGSGSRRLTPQRGARPSARGGGGLPRRHRESLATTRGRRLAGGRGQARRASRSRARRRHAKRSAPTSTRRSRTTSSRRTRPTTSTERLGAGDRPGGRGRLSASAFGHRFGAGSASASPTSRRRPPTFYLGHHRGAARASSRTATRSPRRARANGRDGRRRARRRSEGARAGARRRGGRRGHARRRRRPTSSTRRSPTTSPARRRSGQLRLPLPAVRRPRRKVDFRFGPPGSRGRPDDQRVVFMRGSAGLRSFVARGWALGRVDDGVLPRGPR